jgi:CRISPR-associated endonuclease Csn1
MLGRALYHLAQRRGVLSNRKQMRKTEKEEEGVVRKAIGELTVAIHDSGARSLGEFLTRCSPFEKRIRARWAARSMYVEEFTKIWEAQTRFHPDLLTDSRRKLLFGTIFHQRPLKFDPDVVGRCELEQGERRAPAYLLASQRFRLLDKVNSLPIIPPGEVERPLTPTDRAKLIDALEIKGGHDMVRSPPPLPCN